MTLFSAKEKKISLGKYVLAVAVFAGMLCLAACSSKEVSSTEVITQKVTQKGRTPVTVLTKHAFSINAFEKAVEEKFPDIDIVQIGNYTRNTGTQDYAKRMEHDDLADIIMTWPLDVGEEYWEDRLIELSSMDFTNKYNLSMLNTISRDGKLYYLPGPAQIRGIVYNKTLFKEKGWEVPKDFEGFIELCRTIENSGMRSIQLGFANPEVLDTAFVGYSCGPCYSKPADTQWIENYNNGIGSFGDHFAPALNTFQRFIDEGIWKKEDLAVEYSGRELMFFNRECAMIEDSVLLTRIGYSLTGTKDEFGLMPFFNPGTDSDWARLYMVCYIGLNKHLEEPENKEKLELTMKLMNYISTEEGQNALMADTGAMFSSVKGTALPDVPEIEALVPALTHGRYMAFNEFENVQSALRQGLRGMISGQLTAQDVAERVDAQNENPVPAELPSVLGTASENFSLTDTGSFVSDAIRKKAGSEIALFLDNGKDGRYNNRGIAAKLYKGDLSVNDIDRIINDLKMGARMTLWKGTIKGADLLKTLEYAVPTDNNATGWFYYFSGLKMTFAPAAEPGSRVRAVSMADGQKIDPEKIYTIAAMEDTIPEEYLISCEKTDTTIYDILIDEISGEKTISPAKDGRFEIVDP